MVESRVGGRFVRDLSIKGEGHPCNQLNHKKEKHTETGLQGCCLAWPAPGVAGVAVVGEERP